MSTNAKDSLEASGAGVREGDVLAGKFRVERVLGVGGMGVVVAAHHLQLDEKVALKFLVPAALSNPQAVARFEREARAAVKIKSEHVARVIDVGKLDSGAPYMVMEFLEGGDLSDWLEQRGALPIEQAVEFVLQACEAIAEAHGLGIVHRDLKPANLFCIRRPDGLLSVKVLDFGISKLTSLGGSGPEMGLTTSQAVMGSPFYMSPEQMASAKDVDARTDIWALGAILFELLTKRPPFEAEALPELVLKIVQHETPWLRALRPDIPEGLEAAVRRCLEKDRARRFPNVAELAHALAPFAPKRARSSVERVSRVIQASGLSSSVLALPPSTENSPASAGASTADPTTLSLGETGGLGRTSGGPVKRLAPLLALLGILGLLGIGGLVVIIRAMSTSDTPTAAPTASSVGDERPAAVAPPPAPTEAPAIAPEPPQPPPSASATPAETPRAAAKKASPVGKPAPKPAPVAEAPKPAPAPKPEPKPTPAPAPVVTSTGSGGSSLGGRL
ncbi:MAG: serine/threonine-protein kinase [Polyangiaceae bacterium]